MTDLHLVSWNRPEMTNLVIRTIKRNTKPENYRLVVLDNGSEEKTVEMLQNLHDAGFIDEFIPIKTNLGLEAARNLLLRECTQSERFVCIDNDCLPEPMDDTDWLEKLNELMDKYEDYAAITLRMQVMIGTGNIFEEADKAGDDIVDFSHPGGAYRLMDTKVTHFVGGWERQAPGRGSEETYICGKLRDAGFKTGYAVNIRTLHLFGNKETDKWGYPIHFTPEDTGHHDVHHPVLEQGDDIEEVRKYAGEELTKVYDKRDN